MLTILQILFAALTLGLALFGLLTENYDYQYLMLLSTGLMVLIGGIKELQQEKKAYAYFMLLAAAFMLYVAADGFITG